MEYNEELELFAKLEREIVDEYYKKFELLKYPKEFSVFHLLQGFRHFEIELSNQDHTYFDKSRRLYQVLSGLEKCLYWVLNHKMATVKKERPSFRELEQLLGRFLTWGYEYAILCDFHISTWKNASKVTINQVEKTIKFTPFDKKVLFFSLQESLISDDITFEIIDLISDEVLFAEFERIERLGEYGQISQDILVNYTQFCNQQIFPELDRNTELGGYSLQNFLDFYLSIIIQFKYFIFKESSSGNFNGYIMDRADFVDKISNLARLERTTVSTIISDLTCNNNTKFKLSNTPFILLENKLHYSPLIFTIIEPGRMLISALNKGTKKKIYDHLINNIEQFWTDKINILINAKSNYKVFYKTKYTSHKKIITPDFIIYNKEKNEVAIIDYKHFVIPISIIETFHKRKELHKGEEQIIGYKKFMLEFPEQFLDIKNISDCKIFCIMLFRHPMPVPSLNKSLTYMSYPELSNAMQKTSTISELINIIKPSSRNKEFDIENFSFIEQEIQVEDWRYKYEIMAINSNE